MIFTEEPISAEDALSFGLVSKVVPKDRLLEEAKSFASKLAALPHLALEAAKRLIHRGPEMDLTSALELEARCLGTLAMTHDSWGRDPGLSGEEKTQLYRELNQP